MKIAIFYTGLPRFKDQTKNNHEKLFDRLKTYYTVNIYDFTTTEKRLNCPYNPEDLTVRGNLQVWDFANSINSISENIFIRMRTDLILTPSSIDVIINEIQRVEIGESSVSFLGLSLKRHYDVECFHEKVTSRVLDFIIIADKTTIEDSNLIKNNILKEQIVQGHIAFEKIIKNINTAFNVHCRIVIIRKKYSSELNWEWTAFKDYFLTKPFKKSKNALQWLNQHKKFEDL